MAVTVHHGDCLQVLPTLPDKSVDGCLTDPPYHLTTIVKRFGAENAAPAKDRDGLYARASRGFMGKQWDGGDIAFRPETWAEVYRVLKPGAHLVAFSGSRTYHRMVCAIEDAGFEIRDQIMWLYGSGFPKSHNAGDGWGTALKPAHEPIVLARKPLVGTVAQNMALHGTGAINIDGGRIGADESTVRRSCAQMFSKGGIRDDNGRPALNRSSTGSDVGRWPANVIHDGSAEVLAAFPDAPGQMAAIRGDEPSDPAKNVYGSGLHRQAVAPRNDAGSAARFFYQAKADKSDRLGSKHPTVKPIDLIAYLARLITPVGGTLIDPFAGSGTLATAAMREGFNAILIEREAEYVEDIKRRLAHVGGADAPLFAGSAA